MERLFLLGSLLSGLGDLSTLAIGLLDGLDDTDGNGLPHVTDGESTKRRILIVGLNTHRLAWDKLHDGGITRLDELGGRFHGLTGTTIDLLEELGKLACNMGSVAIEHWRVTGTNLTRVVKDDNLGVEGSGFLGRVVLGVRGNVTTTDIFHGYVLDVETDVVTWVTLLKLFVMHFDGLDFSGYVGWSEGNDHSSLDNTSLDTSDWDCANTTNLVHILKWETEWFIGRTGRRLNGVDSIEEGLALDDTTLGLLGPTLVPWHVG